jgi:hypothetical protein
MHVGLSRDEVVGRLSDQGRACQRSKHRCVPVDNAGSQCDNCRRRSLTCTYDTNEGDSTEVDAGVSSSGPTTNAAGQSRYSPNDQHPQAESPARHMLETQPVPDLTQSRSSSSQPVSRDAADHLSRLLSRIREAMLGGPLTRRYVPSEATRKDRGDYMTNEDILKHFPPKSIADFLSTCCYELASDSFFYFDQEDFKAKLDELYSDEASCLRESPLFLCLVLMVFALGSQFAHLKKGEPLSRQTEGWHDPGFYFYRLARNLLPTATFEASVDAVQVCHITAVYLLPEHAYDTAYLYLSHALRIAVSIDMHRQRSGARACSRDVEIRHRLWWSVFCLDRTVSIKVGRPASIATTDIHTRLPRALPPLDSVQHFDNITFQVANAKLVLIMDSIAKHASLESIATAQGTRTTEKLQDDLHTWKASLSSDLWLEGLESRSQGYRALLHLHLNFHFASILLFRSALLSLLRRHLTKLFGRPEDYEQIEDLRLERFSVKCVDAAKSIIELFDMLQEAHSLGMFSFTDFQGCSTATVVLLLNCMLHGKQTNTRSIETGYACLSFMAIGNDYAKTAITYVQELHSIAEEVLEMSRLTASNHLIAYDDPGVIAYEEWARGVARDPSANLPRTSVPPADDVHPDRLTSLAYPTSLSAVAGPSFLSSDPTLTEDFQYGNASSLELGTPSATMPNAIDDAFLFGLTGLDALDFLLSDDPK